MYTSCTYSDSQEVLRLRLLIARLTCIDEAEAILIAHANAMAPHLRHEWIAGDGNCLYRSVSLQTHFGEEGHLTLRQISSLRARLQDLS